METHPFFKYVGNSKMFSGTNVVAGIQSSYDPPGLAEGALLGCGNAWPEPCGAT